MKNFLGIKRIFKIAVLYCFIFTVPGFGDECIDFSGTWKGICVEPGGNDPVRSVTHLTFVIEQEKCHYFKARLGEGGSEVSLPMGGSRTIEEVFPDGYQTMKRYEALWNSNKTVFVIQSWHENILAKAEKIKRGMQSSVGNILKIEDGQLLISLVYLRSSDRLRFQSDDVIIPMDENSEVSSCKLNKQ